ncbi:MAG TPA: HDOD domain-containing protein [Rhodocyclaceae bacterium]|nr:HDOD domain-containing protein [Rhodocyclaceae bacterium]
MNRNQALMLLIEEAHRGDFHFPTSARLAIKIRQTLDDPECHLDAAGKLISAEPLLAAQVIAMANSVAYNPGGREITDVRTATARLGFRTLRTLAMAFVTRQMAGTPSSPEQKRLAGELWEHTAHVAALARIIAAKVTGKDPETALFCGLVHEIGGFYLLSRVEQYPALILPQAEAADNVDLVSVTNTLSLAVLRNLGVPETVLDAVESYVEGYLASPPTTLADTLILADHTATFPSPLSASSADDQKAAHELAAQNETLAQALKESDADVESLVRALRG